VKAFIRALGYCWPYRYRIVAAWLCAIMVSVLYSSSISSTLPLFRLLFGQTGVSVDAVDETLSDGSVHRVHSVTLPSGYTVRLVPAGEPLRIDQEARVAEVPDGYRIYPGGLQRFVLQAEGKWYQKYIAAVVDRMPEDRARALAVLMLFIVALTALRGIFRYLNESLVSYVACRSVLDLRLRAFDKVLRLPLGYFQKRGGASEASSRLINDAFAVQEGLQSIFGKVVTEPLKAAGCLAAAAWFATQIDPRLLLLILVIGPLTAWLVRTFAKRMKRATKRQLQSAAQILGILEETLAGLRIVKAYSMEGRERKRFFREGRVFLKYSLKAFRTQVATGPSLELMATVGVALAVIAGAFLIGERIGQRQEYMMAFFAAMVGALDPLRKMTNINNRIQMAINGAERIFELTDAEPEAHSGRQGKHLPRLSRSICFDHVSFAYDPAGEQVLRDISFEVACGEVIAIVGRTGCGKSTLVNLIPRFYVPTEGRILIDGCDTAEVSLRSLRDQIGVVSQETILFSDTVAANIAYGSRPAVRARGRSGRVTREEIVEAARLAHAAEFIERMPGGYDAELGPQGATVSGGQRQRIALARAIIRDPAILILDEATSALDEETQSLVQDTLERFVRGRTVFIIAHRLSTVALAHRIVVMDSGRIVDIGRHDELMARCELYRRLRDTGFEDA
jgi:ABC-type multidrug transport system fused ATPase/permease subunit